MEPQAALIAIATRRERVKEDFEQRPFRSNQGVAHCWRSSSEHSVQIGAGYIRRDPRGRVFRVADQLQRVPMLNRLSVGVHPVDIDSGDPRIPRIVVEQIQKIHMGPDIIADRDNAMDDDPGFGAFSRNLTEVFSQRD